MTDLDALLAAVLDRPDDDNPRLVFADCLDDLGAPERAAFVRAQVEAARKVCVSPVVPMHETTGAGDRIRQFAAGEPEPCGACAECVELADLEEQAAAIFEADPARTLEWFGLPQPWARVVRLSPFDPPAAGLSRSVEFPYAVVRRGFIAELELSAYLWRTCAAAIRAAHPVARVRLLTRPSDADQLHQLVTRYDDPAAERPRILDRWHQSPLWPGVKFDLPRPAAALREQFEALRADMAARSYAANQQIMARFLNGTQLDPAPLVVAMDRAAERVRDFGEALAAAARPMAAALTPIARAMAAVKLEPVHVSRKDRRRRRK